MRKNYIDNLRSFIIVLLFPFHTSRMYTTFEINYVQGDVAIGHDFFVAFTSAWFMYMLFLLAGMSTVYSLEKRTLKQYYVERVQKLLIPFFFGVILTIPIQTYYAERFNNGYTGSFLHQYRMFFTKKTDLTGYRGGFTPAHLWFLFILFLLSGVAYPLIKKKSMQIKKNTTNNNVITNNKVTTNNLDTKKETLHKEIPQLVKLLSWSIVIWLASIVSIGGEEIGSYLICFLLGMYVMTKEEVLYILEKNSWILCGMALLINGISAWTSITFDWGNTISITNIAFSILRHFSGWLMILALLGLGKKYLNFTNTASRYMRKNSFSIYFVHQTIMVALGYYVICKIENSIIQYLLIMFGSFLLSIGIVELIKRIPILNIMFGMKPKKNKSIY
ncbi:acyltransferase family protein [Anaerosporobacter faecicola]|uniref:acyltransferase family protein n=1 Tax=Anaerosporobacter faecicola TaxID=2718714 RepID=UPI00143BB454|nr:acyltransferase family protein [Anaerosporobacter faecicola]